MFLGKAKDSKDGIAPPLEDGFPASNWSFFLSRVVFLVKELSWTLGCCSDISPLGAIVGESKGLMIGRKDGLPNELVCGKGDSRSDLSFDVGD